MYRRIHLSHQVTRKELIQQFAQTGEVTLKRVDSDQFCYLRKVTVTELYER